jgi:hypothetical protein
MKTKLRLNSISLTLHSWELPSWKREHLRAATAAALRYALQSYNGRDVRVEIAYNAEATEGLVVNPVSGERSAKGAQLEIDLRGGTDDERHTFRHFLANEIEGIMRRTLQMFILHDAQNRYRQMKAGYKTYDEVDEPQSYNGVLT